VLPALVPGLVPAAHADVLEFGWTAEGFIDPAAGEGGSVRIALDAAGTPTAIWSGRADVQDPYRLVLSTYTGDAWTPAAPFLPQVGVDEIYPQVSRAQDGTIWLAWLRHDTSVGSSNILFSTLVCSRYADGAWSVPEIITSDLARPAIETYGLEFTILGVSRDSAWVAFTPTSRSDPFTQARDLYWSAHSASGWSAPALVAPGGSQNEWRPVLAPTNGRQPVAFFGYRDEPTTLRALLWDGTQWSAPARDTLKSTAFHQWAAAPDTSGAIRLLVMQREGDDPFTDRIREFAWNDSGFVALDAIAELPVVGGQGNEPPQWDGLSYAPGKTLVYRGFWMDFSLGSIPIVTSAQRTSEGFGLPEIVGRAFSPVDALPNGTYDVNLDRWYAVWIGAPSSIALPRPKFAWTQEFAGELGIGARFIAPDTVRVTVACTGDGEGRAFHVYRLRWDDEDTVPPFPPPVPAEAVEIPGSPVSDACPFRIDDFPGEGRWYYYVALDADGTFPARYARSFSALNFGGGNGGGPAPTTTALRSPRPSPANGPVSLPYDLASGGEVTLIIHDLLGRPRRRVELGAKPAGSYVSGAPVWDGRDDAGREVPSGMYFVRLVVDGAARATQRLVIVR
jgi:hypothetical protein